MSNQSFQTPRSRYIPRLEAVLAFDHPALIARLRRKESMTEAEAREAFIDTLKFLYLCGTSEGESFVPAPKIDVVWHHFILFTAVYAAFCDKFFGTFIHHVPAEARIEDSAYLTTIGLTACQTCLNCEGSSSGHSVRLSSKPSLEATLLAARSQFGELSPNWS